MSKSHRSHAIPSSAPTARRGGLAVAILVAVGTLVAVLPGCASTPGGRAHDQVESGVDAVGRDAWEEAEFRWLKALAIDPDDARALNNLAVLSERRGEREEAEERYRQALERATPAERTPVEQNFDKFAVVGDDTEETDDGPAMQQGDEDGGSGDDGPAGKADATTATGSRGAARSAPIRTREVTITVDAPGGANLSQYERILVGNFVIAESPAEINPGQVNVVAVRFLRRRLVQRTFFQTIDLLEPPLTSRGPQVLEQAQLWVDRAAEVEADLVLTGTISLDRSDSSRVVREQIRSPVTGDLEEVARFRQMTRYAVTFDYLILRGEDGEVLKEGSLEAEREFSVEQGPSESDAIAETFESLLPQLLEVITPRRAEQTRVLLY